MSFAEGYLMGLQIKERRAQDALRAREWQQELQEQQTEFKSKQQDALEERQMALWQLSLPTTQVTNDGQVITIPGRDVRGPLSMLRQHAAANGLNSAGIDDMLKRLPAVDTGAPAGAAAPGLDSPIGGGSGAQAPQVSTPAAGIPPGGPAPGATDSGAAAEFPSAPQTRTLPGGISVTDTYPPVNLNQTFQDLQPYMTEPADAAYVKQRLVNISSLPTRRAQAEAANALMKEMRDKQIQMNETAENRKQREQLHQESIANQRQMHEENMALRKDLKGELTGAQAEHLAEGVAALDNSLDIADRVRQNLPVLNSMIAAGKIQMSVSPNTGDLIISRAMKLTPQEAQLAADFQSLSEHVNTLRGPLGATGFRGPEAFAALQSQRGNLLANPAITKRVLDTTIKSMTAIRDAKAKYLDAHSGSSDENGAPAPSKGRQGPSTPAPDTHRFNLSKWKQAHPRATPQQIQNVTKQAQDQGYSVVNQ